MVNEQSYHLALSLLREASTPFGFVAAVQEYDNYKRVWTRDGVITSIAALLSGDQELISTAKATIHTIFSKQHQNGFMPSNVSPLDGAASYGGTSGRADNPSWAVIGLATYSILTNDYTLWEKFSAQSEKCLSVMEAWEFNGKNLIYVPQSGDWADEYIQHGYILFDQLLRIWALRLVYRISKKPSHFKKAQEITNTITQNYWHTDGQKNAYAPNLVHQLKGNSADYWLMGFNPSRIYSYFDLQANSFCLLLGIGNDNQNEILLHYLKDLYTEKQSLLPSFAPTIEDHDADMNELKNNYAYAFRNLPNYFHNGGLWPVWNGWLIAALHAHKETDLALQLITNLHDANRKENSFNECLHGEDKNPCGVEKCTWSAAGAIIAEQVAIHPLFKTLFNA
ncbi:fructofuranosidase/invertase [Agrobacterium tumefaciens]|nr:fructofuranosidase/invertase [Agrobacterium tumefaciens]NTE26236.1 fructofuranosidase/invertase [Agrobacterium tumefaciens]